MTILRNFAVFLVLISIITQSECNEKIYDTYFNGHCYWTEEVSYHVHYATGCKVYFTCQRGKFLDFHRCPESTTFNTATLQCDANGICKDDRSINPTYKTWWKTVEDVIDEVFEVLGNMKDNSISSNTPETSQKEQDVAVTALPLPPTPLVENIKPTDSKQFSVDSRNTHLIESVSLPIETNSTSDSSKKIDSSNAVVNMPKSNTFTAQCDSNGVCELHESVNTKPPHPIATPRETKHTSVHIVPMQFDAQTLLQTESFSSYVTPKALLHEDISKTVDQLGHEAFAFSSNTTKAQNFMDDFIFPIVQEILKNSTIMSKINQLFDVIFESGDPVLYQLLDQKVDEKLGSSITISIKELKDTWNRTTFLACPIVKEIMRYTSPLVLEKAAEHTEVLLDFLERDDIKVMENIPSLFGAFLDIVFKYRLLNKPTVSDQLTSYSLIEIRKDMKRVFEILTDMVGDKLYN